MLSSDYILTAKYCLKKKKKVNFKWLTLPSLEDLVIVLKSFTHSLTHSFNYEGNECLGAGHVLGILDTAVDKRDKSPRLPGAYILVGDSGNK